MGKELDAGVLMRFLVSEGDSVIALAARSEHFLLDSQGRSPYDQLVYSAAMAQKQESSVLMRFLVSEVSEGYFVIALAA
jgi:hypothetical protein